MLDLKPLYVVTGTVHMNGGEQNRTRGEPTSRDGNRMILTVDRRLTPDRRKAKVIVRDWGRRFDSILTLRTPFGVLLDPARHEEFRALVAHTNRKISEFNEHSTTCRVTNNIICERLAGVRRERVLGWLAVHERDDEVAAALPLIRLAAA